MLKSEYAKFLFGKDAANETSRWEIITGVYGKCLKQLTAKC